MKKRIKRKKAKSNGSNHQPTAAEILAKGGLTDEQIAAGRLGITAERMAWGVWLAQLLIVEGIGAWRELQPDTPDDVIKAWAVKTLKAARLELVKGNEK
jgi:hypothetical protein